MEYYEYDFEDEDMYLYDRMYDMNLFYEEEDCCFNLFFNDFENENEFFYFEYTDLKELL